MHLFWKNGLDCMPRRKVRAFLSAVGGKYMGIPIVKPKSQKLP